MEAQQRVLHGCAKIHTFYDAITNKHFGYHLFLITFFSSFLCQGAPYQARFDFSMKSSQYLLELFDLGVLEIPQGVRVFLLNVTQTCVTDLQTHFPDICECRS